MDITTSTTAGASLTAQGIHSIAAGVTVSNATATGTFALTIASGISGTPTVVTNNGTVTSTSSTRAVGNQSNNYITLNNIGTINNTSTGIGVQLNDNVTVTNNGTISSVADRALRLNDNATVTNYGTISSTATGQHTLQLNNNATVTNYGTISGSGSERSLNLQIGTVDNNGTITASGSGRALQVSTSGTVTNGVNGVISSTGTGDAIRFVTGTLTNRGVISTTDNSAQAIHIEAGTSADIHNYGRITAGNKGINHKLTAGDLTVTNYAGGTITGRDSGIASEKGGTVVNYGRIEGLTDDGIDFDGSGTITNYGTISCSAAPGTTPTGPDSAEGITTGGGTITNYGTITSAHNGIYGVISASAPTPTAAAATTVINSGTITGNAGYGIRMFGTFNDTLTNSGTIIGGIGTAVDMGAGDDQVTITGGRIQGMIVGGDGNDTITFNMGAGRSFILETGLQGFETVTLQSGTLYLSGASIDTSLTAGVGTGLGFDITRSAASVTGTVTLGGTLSLSQITSAVLGQTYILLNNDGSDAIVGTFAGLGEGTALSLDGFDFRVSYRGGTGNDLTLTVLKVPEVTVPVVPPTPPVVIPTTQEQMQDGVTVTTRFGSLPSGAAAHTITVPTVVANRINSTGSVDVADIALIRNPDGSALLTTKLGLGQGLTSHGSAASLNAGNAVTDFGQLLNATLGSSAGDQAALMAGAQSYLNGLGATRVIVESLTPTWGTGSTGSLALTGQANAQEALLIDLRGQTSPTVVLEAVDFAVVLGSGKILGSGAAQTLVGDNSAQTFLLGAQNDTVSAGGGNDRIQAGGGNNVIDGGAGIDTVRLAGNSANARISQNTDGSLSVTTAGGTDTLSNIEILRFDDGIRLVAPKTASSGGYTVQEDFYLAQNPDVAAAVKAGIFTSGAEHFARYGHLEGRTASVLFDTDAYLAQNLDVAAAVQAGRTMAYDHFVTFGWKEGRNPSAWFNTKAYLVAHPDVAANGIDPLTHFLLSGGQGATAADTGLWA